MASAVEAFALQIAQVAQLWSDADELYDQAKKKDESLRAVYENAELDDESLETLLNAQTPDAVPSLLENTKTVAENLKLRRENEALRKEVRLLRMALIDNQLPYEPESYDFSDN